MCPKAAVVVGPTLRFRCPKAQPLAAITAQSGCPLLIIRKSPGPQVDFEPVVRAQDSGGSQDSPSSMNPSKLMRKRCGLSSTNFQTFFRELLLAWKCLET